ncbi:MAG: MaoC/PaaZ C-terminal domain-containing protein [Desulfotignum sp.]|nr:MaoC/PaaZ C-terminal domain-containing protein [Desulfotignum sp.]
MSTDIQQIPLTETIYSVHLTHLPLMPAIFCRLLISALGKQFRLPGPGPVTKARLHLNGVLPDRQRIDRYRRVCGFSHAPCDPIVPPGFLQTLFIGLLGRYITSDFFPINPMGLIQTGQQFESRSPVRINDSLDLSCTLEDMTLTAKGIFTRFLLEISRENRVVWQGISTYLTRTPSPADHAVKTVQDRPLPILMTIHVPSGTGRKYARVSGDYNPHHLSDVTARIIGFKQAMAHGMWSLARTLACLERSIKFASPFFVEAAFKLPVYMPATLRVGSKEVISGGGRHQVLFDLRDAVTRRPHLKGRVTHPGKMS